MGGRAYLSGGGHADAVGSETVGEDLGDVDLGWWMVLVAKRSRQGILYLTHPWHGSPRRRVSNDVEVDHDDHTDGRRGDVVRLGVGRVSVQHRADDVHHGHHPQGADQQRLPASEALDAQPQEQAGRDDLDSAVDAGGEQRRVRLGHAHRLEDLRRVVADAVRARELLAEHEPEAREEAVAHAWLQAFLPRHALGHVQFLLDGCADLG